MTTRLLYSIAGLVLGFLVGKWFHLGLVREAIQVFSRQRDTASDRRPRGDTMYDPHAAIPTVIPVVRFDPDSGEPIIAKEEVHHPSPIPRSVSIIVIILAAMSLAFIFYTKTHDADMLSRANERLATQVNNNQALLEQLQHQQAIVNNNEKRLEDLVLAISAAKTPGEVTAAIQRFLKSSAQARQQERNYQQEHGGQANRSAYSHPEDTRGSPSPQPSSSASPTSSPSPSPSRSPSPSPSPSSTVQVCITTPLGRVCEPSTLFFI